jgi:hypothetical protein
MPAVDRKKELKMTDSAQEMPLYNCHKQVRALKIARVETLFANNALLHFEDPQYPPKKVDSEFIRAKKPQAGGYYVEYEPDHYPSFSPAKAFEDGYSLATPQNAEGPRLSRNGDGDILLVHEGSVMTTAKRGSALWGAIVARCPDLDEQG